MPQSLHIRADPFVDVASRYKEAEPLTSKDTAECAKAFQMIYKHSPMKWPQLMQVDPHHEFIVGMTKKWK